MTERLKLALLFVGVGILGIVLGVTTAKVF